MSEDILCTEIDTNETFAETVRAANNGSFDFAKYGQYVDKVRPFLGSRLEGRIYSVLKEFVCDPSSRCSKCFPCVKRWLETSAAWADYIDAFLAKDTNVGEEMIKCAMKYLAEDGLVTQFTNSDGLNNGVDRMCHGLGAIVGDRNDLKSMNVCRYINEKDYWLPEGCANAASIDVIFKPPHSRGNCSSDLEVEVDSCSERTFERSLRQSRTNSNRLCREEDISDCVCKTEHNTREGKNARRNSKLKVLIYQTANDNSSTGLTPAKLTNLSVPCRPSHLMVRIFEAAPSLTESCLILMRKKFENGIRTACSCLNGMLRKLDDAEMKELRLVCEIRPGYIDLNLRRPRTSKPRLFLARLPICRSHPKRGSCCKRAYGRENAAGFQYRRNPDISDCCSREGAERDERIARETRRVVFYLSRSHYDSTSETIRSSSEDEKTDARKVSEKEMNFVWTRKPVKEVSFCFANAEAEEPATSSDSSCKPDVCDNADRYVQEEVIKVPQACSHIEQTPSDEQISNNTAPERTDNNIESCDSASSYPDSLRKVERREDHSGLDMCNSQQCLCHVLYERSDRNARENAEPQCAEKKDERDNVIEVEKSNSAEQGAPARNGASGAKQAAELAEEFSADSICSLNSNYSGASRATKCSCCGEDLSDVEIHIESENLTVSIESKPIASRTDASIGEDQPSKTGQCPDRIICMRDSTRTSSSNNFPACQPSRTISRENRESSIRNCRATVLFDRHDTPNEKVNYQIGGITSNDVCKNSAAIYEGKGPREADGDHGRVLATTAEQLSRRSNASDSLLEDDLRGRDRERKPGSPRRRASLRSKFRKSSRQSTRFTVRDSYSTRDLREDASKSRRKQAQNRSDCACKSRFWSRATTPGYLCGSFPAASLDRLKYLIRRKLRRLLLEERNKGTNTSKTFLRNERYCVSASSEKLNEGTRDTSSSDRPDRCSRVAGDRSNDSGWKRGILNRAVKSRCRNVTRCGVLKKIMVARVCSPRRDSKLIGACCSAAEGRDDARRASTAKTMGTVGDSSAKRFFVEEDAKQRFRKHEKRSGEDEVFCKRSQNRKKFEKEFCPSSSCKRNSMRSPCRNCRVCDSSASSFEAARNRRSIRNMSSVDIGSTGKLKNLRLFKENFGSGANCDRDIVIVYSDYERYVNEICADFRLKLLQYVALCKSVKDTMLKRLRSDALVIRSNST